MSGKKPRDSLSTAEKKLWQKVTENISRLNNNQAMTPLVRKSYYLNNMPENVSFSRQRPLAAPAARLNEQGFSLKDIDHNWQKRLRRGKVKPEGKIDLHGMSQDRAFDALTRYIEEAHRRGKRSILVVTGKGRQKTGAKGSGILRANVPRWLSQGALAQYIVSYYSANIEHGADGALYVVLKRGRETRPGRETQQET
ncbi:MAG: Smr/MutS family protein [Emcibacter sp.]|nr:Smr/MutS family protein [Emcibacter sp.]